MIIKSIPIFVFVCFSAGQSDTNHNGGQRWNPFTERFNFSMIRGAPSGLGQFPSFNDLNSDISAVFGNAGNVASNGARVQQFSRRGNSDNSGGDRKWQNATPNGGWMIPWKSLSFPLTGAESSGSTEKSEGAANNGWMFPWATPSFTPFGFGTRIPSSANAGSIFDIDNSGSKNGGTNQKSVEIDYDGDRSSQSKEAVAGEDPTLSVLHETAHSSAAVRKTGFAQPKSGATSQKAAHRTVQFSVGNIVTIGRVTCKIVGPWTEAAQKGSNPSTPWILDDSSENLDVHAATPLIKDDIAVGNALQVSGRRCIVTSIKDSTK